MKPTSIIFIIMAVIIIAAGVITCAVASNLAREAGIELYNGTVNEDGDSVIEYVYSSDKVNKLLLDLGEADVTIIGGADESRVELVNFSQNRYELSVSESCLTVSDSLNLMSFLKMTSGGGGFSGFRHYLRDGFANRGRRRVTIYISGEETIRQINVSVGSGSVNISGITQNADFTVNSTSGDVSLNALSEISTVTMTLVDGDAGIITSSRGGNFNVTLRRGELKLIAPDYTTRSWSLSAPLGGITMFGNVAGSVYEHTAAGQAGGRFTAKVDSGAISVELMPDTMIPAETTAGETDGDETTAGDDGAVTTAA